MNRRVAIIGVPSSAGAHWPGQEKTPYALRRAGLLDRLDTEGFEVMDLGDLAEDLCRLHPEERRHQNLTAVADVARQVADRVAAARKMGALPLVIGGDCTITVGAVSGFLETTNSRPSVDVVEHRPVQRCAFVCIRPGAGGGRRRDGMGCHGEAAASIESPELRDVLGKSRHLSA